MSRIGTPGCTFSTATVLAARVLCNVRQLRMGMRWVASIACMLCAIGHAIADPLNDAETAFMHMNYADALALWRPLAEHGNAKAEIGMGRLYDFGAGVPKDAATAKMWYQRASDQGDAEGECIVGQNLVMGFGDANRDVSQGLALMKRAAADGSSRCPFRIGELYRNGIFGVPKDPVEAAAWHRKGAEMGDELAEGRLGVDYQFGIGVQQDSAKSAYWYQKEIAQMRHNAERGDVVAQLDLGEAYLTATSGLPWDKAAALFWCGKAAQQKSRVKIFAEQCKSLAQ